MIVPQIPPSLTPAPENHPIDLWNTIGPPPFPLGVLPKVIEEYAIVMANHMGANASGLAMAALTVAGAAIPDRIKIQVKANDSQWKESARLWTLLIGPPSAKKSPIIRSAICPIAKMDGALIRQWQQQHRAWAALSKEARAQMQEPLQRRLRIEDTTIEAAQEVLRGSQDGVLSVQDEASGWFGAMERYTSAKGASVDRAFWLRAYDGGEYSLNRVGRGSIVIDNLSISLIGGIQPDPLRKIVGSAVDDGLMQRMIPIFLGSSSVGLDKPRPNVQEAYDFTISLLPHLPIMAPLRFDEDAQLLRQKLEEKHHRQMTVEMLIPKFASHVGKFDGLFARLCIIWHVLEHGLNLPPVVSYETANRVAVFMDKLIFPHIACFYSNLGLSDDHEKLKSIAEHILAHKLQKVTVRDVQRGTRAMRNISTHHALPLLQQLVALNWLAEEPGPRATSDPRFIVNLYVHHLYSERAEKERQRREQARSIMAETFGK